MFHSVITIKKKLILTFASIFIFAFLISGFTAYYHFKNITIQLGKNDIDHITEVIAKNIESFSDISIKTHLHTIAQTNKQIIAGYYDLYKKNEITYDIFFKSSKDALLSQKIGDTGYLYVLDIKNAPNKIHPDIHPRIEKKDLSSFQFIKDMAEIKEGYIEYMWKENGKTDELEKSASFVFFEPLNWVIAASSYKNEFDKLVNIYDFRESILSLTVGESGYPYVMNSKGLVLIHPDLEGQNVSNGKDVKGYHFFKDMLKIKDGWIEYYWKKINDENPYPKLVRFRYIPSHDWIIACGIYIDELEKPIQRFVDF